MESNLVRADNSNLQEINAFMVAIFFKNNADYYAAELKNVKTAVQIKDAFYRCTTCKSAFKLKYLDYHKKLCTPKHLTLELKPLNNQECDVKVNFPCPECGKLFSKEGNLTNHLSHVHKRKPQQKTFCTECNKTFTRSNTLKNHIKKVHMGLVEFHQCDICGERFRAKIGMENHIKAIHLKKFKIHCEFCGKGFLWESGLNQHIKLVHEERSITIIPCTEAGCLKTFSTKGSLRYHMNAEHVKVKPKLECEQCNKTFTHPFLYKQHLRDHKKGPQRNPCSICKKVVARRNFKDHLRSHTGERPFLCELCGRGFKSNNALKAHVVVHTKEKPFGCKVCNKRFSHRSSITVHTLKSHPEVMDKRC